MTDVPHRGIFTVSLAATGVVFVANAGLAIHLYSGPLGTMPVLLGIAEFNEIWTTHSQHLAIAGALDSVGAAALLLVFVGLYSAFRDQNRLHATLGLGVGLLTTAIDSIENALTILLAQNASLNEGHELSAWLPVYSLATNLKWFWAGTALAAFAAACPNRDTPERAFTVLALGFAAAAILGLGSPTLAVLRSVFLLPALPILGWLFWCYRRTSV